MRKMLKMPIGSLLATSDTRKMQLAHRQNADLERYFKCTAVFRL